MSKTHYHTSDGEILTRSELDKRIKLAKEQKISDQLNDYGHNFCVMCRDEEFPLIWNNLEHGILDCSHVISIKEATESGRSELCYNQDNIQIICRIHHRRFDNNQLKFKK